MRLLLDTHIYLWCVKGDRKLSKNAKEKITKADEVFISSATIWEASIKVKLGKLDVDIDELIQEIDRSGFSELPITIKHAAYLSELPNLHKDPFDRILLAQAICEPLQFLTMDNQLKAYSSLVEII